MKTTYSLHTVIWVTAMTVYIFSTPLWFPQDSQSGKNKQRRGTFKSLNFINDNEKNHSNKLGILFSQSIRAKSHLYFFEKCLKRGVYPENLNVSDHLQVAFKTSKFTSACNDLNNKT